MSHVPFIVTTDWLAERLDDSKLRLSRCNDFFKIAGKRLL